MVRLAEGDRSAFDTVFTMLWPVMHDYAARVLRGGAEADDAAQEALLRLLDHASRFDRSRDGLTWALAIVANQCRFQRRTANRRSRRFAPLLLETTAPQHAGQSPEAALLRRELETQLGRTIDSLPPIDRATILTALGSTAEAREVSPQTWRKRWHRARLRLRQAWSARHGD